MIITVKFSILFRNKKDYLVKKCVITYIEILFHLQLAQNYLRTYFYEI